MRFGGTGKRVSVKNRPTVNQAAVGLTERAESLQRGELRFPDDRLATGGRTDFNQRRAECERGEMRRLQQTYPGLGIGKWRP